jgi:hypothetical protein
MFARRQPQGASPFDGAGASQNAYFSGHFPYKMTGASIGCDLGGFGN